jgi:hypothetical protein
MWKFTSDKTPNDAKISYGLGPGELKILKSILQMRNFSTISWREQVKMIRWWYSLCTRQTHLVEFLKCYLTEIRVHG